MSALRLHVEPPPLTRPQDDIIASVTTLEVIIQDNFGAISHIEVASGDYRYDH